MLNVPRWIIRLTHLPTKISITVTSHYHRIIDVGREKATKVLRSKLWLKNNPLPEREFTYDIDEPYPLDLMKERDE